MYEYKYVFMFPDESIYGQPLIHKYVELNFLFISPFFSVSRAAGETNTSRDCMFSNKVNAVPLHPKQAEGKFWYGTTHTRPLR